MSKSKKPSRCLEISTGVVQIIASLVFSIVLLFTYIIVMAFASIGDGEIEDTVIWLLIYGVPLICIAFSVLLFIGKIKNKHIITAVNLAVMAVMLILCIIFFYSWFLVVVIAVLIILLFATLMSELKDKRQEKAELSDS